MSHKQQIGSKEESFRGSRNFSGEIFPSVKEGKKNTHRRGLGCGAFC